MMSSHEQTAHAYRRMASEGRYRPAAPSDGMGNITVPVDELVLEDEAEQYARRWLEEEDTEQFYVGCCNYPTRPATIFAIEAARLMCGANDACARDLLRMALGDLDTRLADDADDVLGPA